MFFMKSLTVLGIAAYFVSSISLAATNSTTNLETNTLYQANCASCHGAARLGGMGPALFPENLSRLRKKKAAAVIQHGRTATQMPAFEKTLSTVQIDQLVDYIYQPPAKKPTWKLADIKQTHIIHFKQDTLPNKPVFSADLMNLFIVVELGDHHASVLNGDTFKPIHRFKTRFALHGGPKYSPDGRFVYFASRDGWISKFDIYNLKTVAEIRAGINTRNLAVSSDGKTIMVANYLPHTLVALNTDDLSPIKIIPVDSRISAVYNAPPRNSFIAALKDIKEVWEIPYNNETPLSLRKISLDDYLDDFFFDTQYKNGASHRPRQRQKSCRYRLIRHAASGFRHHLDIPRPRSDGNTTPKRRHCIHH